MFRAAYLASLVVLQAALMAELTPQLAESIRVHSAILHAWDANSAWLRLALASIAAVGATLLLAAPALALLRHHQRGGLRFLGLPPWAVHCTVAGAALFTAAFVAPHVIGPLPEAAAWFGQSIAGPVRDATFALMAGGALGAELLRRSVALPRPLRETMPMRQVLVEVVHPDDLRTRAT